MAVVCACVLVVLVCVCVWGAVAEVKLNINSTWSQKLFTTDLRLSGVDLTCSVSAGCCACFPLNTQSI